MAEVVPPLEANVVLLADPDDDKIGIHLPKDDDDMFASLPPDFTHCRCYGCQTCIY